MRSAVLEVRLSRVLAALTRSDVAEARRLLIAARQALRGDAKQPVGATWRAVAR